MTEADIAETEELSVPSPVAITWQNIKTEMNGIKSIRLGSDMHGLYIDEE